MAVTTDAKQTPERAWLAEVSAVPLQRTLRDLATAYTKFFASVSGQRSGPRIGPPRWKKRAARQSARFTRNAFALKDNGRLYVAKVGELRVAWSRDLPSESSSVTIIKTASGQYYASFVVAVDDGAELLEPLPDPDAETPSGLCPASSAAARTARRLGSLSPVSTRKPGTPARTG